MTVLSFAIKTIPDVDSGRRLYQLGGLDDVDVGRAMVHHRRQETGGNDALALHLHRIVAISLTLSSGDDFKVWSLGDASSDEAELVRLFFDGIEKWSPTLVSWNGTGFGLPVLYYRALRHGIVAPHYWGAGERNQSSQVNKGINGECHRHLDLMDILSGFDTRAAAPLDEIAVMLGLPGEMRLCGSKVWDTWVSGQVEAIRHYCEADALNTFLIYLRFKLMRGRLTSDAYQQRCETIHERLLNRHHAHLAAFARHWIRPDAEA